jgi:hypothetical protein
MRRIGGGGVWALAWLAWTLPAAYGQGQDSTPGERNLRVIAELLPGAYDNANQQYFDGRRQLPQADRHPRIHTTITRIDAPAFGPYAFLWINQTGTGESAERSWRIATLEAGPAPDEVTMKHYFRLDGPIAAAELATLRPADLRRTDGCDYYFRRRADHFRGLQRERTCRFRWEGEEVHTANEIQVSQTSLWFIDHKYVLESGRRVSGVASGEPFWLERARTFHCYVDIPGVGGGADIPFQRYDDITLHDKGGLHWLRTREATPREIGVSLRAVTWHVLNERGGNFNRNSLVLYVMERPPDGTIREHGYAFTEPDADRIGVNLKWMLVNCAMTRRDAARPEM